MDRWIQDRDRLSKQLEKCQMKYDNATVLQKAMFHKVLLRIQYIPNSSLKEIKVLVESCRILTILLTTFHVAFVNLPPVTVMKQESLCSRP